MKNRAALALIVTMAIQAFASFAANSTAVLAPEIAPALGLSPALIGAFVGVTYLGAMVSSLASGEFIDRYGAIRVSQICVVACAVGAALVAGPFWLLPLAPLLIGLGYGAITPASSQLLARTAPPQRMALTFSIKQTGVPLGVALAGLLLPALALAVGWRGTLFGIAGVGVAIALAAETTRRDLDTGLHAERAISMASVFAPLRLILRDPILLELTITALIFAVVQGCLMSYLVVFLTQAAGYSLIASGLALTVANVGGMIGRISWGMVADRWLAPRLTLAVVGVTAGACALATAGFSAGWPQLLLLGICALFGATATGWNGVQLSEIARNAPHGQAGAVTGASGFISSLGIVLGPPCFALLVGLTGSYRIGFVVVGVLIIGCSVRPLLLRHRRASAL